MGWWNQPNAYESAFNNWQNRRINQKYDVEKDDRFGHLDGVTVTAQRPTQANSGNNTVYDGGELTGALVTAKRPTNYTIQSGDTLGAIAKKYGVALSDLAAWNNIEDPNRIYAGQTLVTNGKPGTTQQTTAKSMTSTKQQVSTPVRRNIPMENMAVLNVPTTIPKPSAITMPVNTNVKSMISPDNYVLSERDRRRMFRKALAETRKYQIALNNGEIDRNDENLINERTARLRSLFNFASAGNA